MMITTTIMKTRSMTKITTVKKMTKMTIFTTIKKEMATITTIEMIATTTPSEATTTMITISTK